MDKKPPLQLVFFDMEGTIFRPVVESTQGIAPSAWTLLAQHLGNDALEEEERTKLRWQNGEYSGYVAWMEDTIRIHQKHGLDYEFFMQVMNAIKYQPGVQETFVSLRGNGIKTALISGGFKANADRAQIDLKIDHSLAACEYFWDADGKISHWNLLPCDYEGKVEFMKLIMSEYKLKPTQCAFVGDGRNDVPLAKAVGTSIAFNGAEGLQQITTHAINQEKGHEDFRAILEYLI